MIRRVSSERATDIRSAPPPDNPSIRSLATAGASFASTRVGALAVGFYLSWWLAQQGGAALWGHLTLRITILNVATILVVFGWDTLLVKFVSPHLQGESSIPPAVYLRAAQFVGLASVGAWLVGYGVLRAVGLDGRPDDDLVTAVSAVLPALPGFAFLRLNAAVMRARQQTTRYGVFNNLLHLLLFTAIIQIGVVAVDMDLDGPTLFYAYIAAVYAVAAISALNVVLNLTFSDRVRPTMAEPDYHLSTLTRQSLPLMMVASMSVVMLNTDIFMLGWLAQAAEVGIYDVAIKISGMSTLALLAINAVVMPKFATLHQQGKLDQLGELARSSTKLTFWLSTPVLVFLFVAGPWILQRFGAEFTSGGGALRILLVGQLVNTSCGSVSALLQMTNNERQFQRIFLVATLANVVLNALLIPRFGITGAAIASAVATVSWNLGGVVYSKQALGISTLYVPFTSRNGHNL